MGIYFKQFYEDNIKINSQFGFYAGIRNKRTLAHFTNVLSEDYQNKLYKLYLKYKKFADYDIELKQNLDFIYNRKLYKFDLYLIIGSYDNEITFFINKSKHDYPKKPGYDISRMIDFHVYIKTMIKKIKEGLALNITVPYIVCSKFLKDIKHLKDFNYLYKFIKKYYLPKCRQTIGLCHLKNGKKLYKLLVNNTLGIKKSPESIHKLGLKLIKDCKLEKNPDDNYKSREEFLDDCKNAAKFVYDEIIDKYFNYKPDKQFEINVVPKELESSSGLAFYDPGNNKIFINLYFYNECTKSSLYSLFIHECMHQYHYSYMKHYKLEKYQIFGYENLAFIEGFAHYMEIYVPNYNDNTNEYTILRKLRLVVDTGINYYGWNYNKALETMNKYLPHREKDNISEIHRYISIPTQALCYTIGKYEIIKLRDRFLKEKRGSIKDFHHKLLINGPVSFIYLEKILF
jgi:uncharacterized protein (DUF885 family)